MIRKIIDIITTLLVVLVVALALSLAGIRIMGGGAYAVLSGSMEPAYHVGSLVYVRPIPAEELKEGDVITFAVSEEVTATHRIEKVLKSANAGVSEDQSQKDGAGSSLRFVTKGDANQEADATPVDSRNVLGKPVIAIPRLGYVVTYMRKPPGSYVAMAMVALLILAMIFSRPGSNSKPARRANEQ